LDSSRFELYLFHLGQHGDDETAWARLKVHQYIGTPQTLAAWANVIADAQLDALIYPEIGMHTV
jgi:predicted O-linked N-acetylglucosamine transferase (SPINDLY family)